MAYLDKLWQETPLVRSIHISSLLGCNGYLKLEVRRTLLSALHVSSFKCRGISHFAQNALRTHGPDTHLIIASRNAGLAAACAAGVLKLRCTVFLPHGVGQSTIDFMRKVGAEVEIGGTSYSEALQRAQEAIAAETNAVVIPSYHHPLLWEGHASMVHEIQHQLPEGVKPYAIFCSVGGGGLAGGVMEGCKAVGWDNVPLVTVETHGSSCFYQSLFLNEGPFSDNVLSRLPSEGTSAEYCQEHNVTLARLAKLNSRATSLGATSPSGAVVKKALDRSGGVKSICIPDELAMQTALSFAGENPVSVSGEDHKILVELACAATLSPAHSPTLFRKVVPETKQRTTVIFIMCGVKVSLSDLEEYRGIVAPEVAARMGWTVACNGENLTIPM
ncbi:hypothetical protein V8D89_007322 [Ganoderma adspersum]